MYGDFTLANNVIFNYRHRTVDGGDHRSLFNIINNYFKPGIGTPPSAVAYRILKPESKRSKTVVDHFGQAYVQGNFVEGYPDVSKDNWAGGVQPDSKAPAKDVLTSIRVDRAFDHSPLPIEDAQHMSASCCMQARHFPCTTRSIRGSSKWSAPARSRRRSCCKVREKAADAKYAPQWIEELAESAKHGFITDPEEVGGYPEYNGTPYRDSDHDGIPDDWEVKFGLNPHDPADATQDANGDGYTNIEDFINGLDPRAERKDWTDLRLNIDPRMEPAR